MVLNKYKLLLLLFFLSFFRIIKATHFNQTLPHQHPDPESIVQEFHRRVNVSITRREMLSIQEKDQCLTGNPIDDCWKCDPNWQTNRQSIADCGIGFGHDAMGGKGGQMYVVNDASDNPDNPAPGTLRFGTTRNEPVWITFSGNMVIKLNEQLVINSFKTIDGRGADIHITGAGCLSIQHVTNVIIHNIHIHDCEPKHSDGDGITVRDSRKIWVDHCSLSSCKDGLIDVTEGSTGVTISNSYFTKHEKVMLLGHSDDFDGDKGMQVTVAFNHFGEGLKERMPRCRWGYFHVVNNDYTQWGEYAVGGSSHPTINCQGNRFLASEDASAKEVTARMDTNKDEWSKWNWRSDGDIMLNGAFFVPSGDGVGVKYALASSLDPRSAGLIDQLTMNAGVLGDNRDQNRNIPSPGSSGGIPSPVSGGIPAPGSSGGIPSPVSGDIPAPGSSGGIPSPVSGDIPAPGSSGVIPSPGLGGGIPAPGSSGVIPSPGFGGSIPTAPGFPGGGGDGTGTVPGMGGQGGYNPGYNGMIYGNKASTSSPICMSLLIMGYVFIWYMTSSQILIISYGLG